MGDEELPYEDWVLAAETLGFAILPDYKAALSKSMKYSYDIPMICLSVYIRRMARALYFFNNSTRV